MYCLDSARGVQTPSSEVHKTNNFKYPLSKSRDKQYKVKPGERLRVNMTSDTFIEEADEWRDEMWQVIRQRSDVVFWILTKRPERIMSHLPVDWGDGYENVSINVTCENQEMFDRRIDYLLGLPAKHKGLCLAPLISDIDISYALDSGQIEEVSCGGENYDNPRIIDFAWVQHIADTCRKYRVNFVWYETGTNLLVGDKRYYITSKQKQSIEAFFSGVNQRYYDIKFKLYDSDGRLLDEPELYKRKYNLNHCLFCSNQDMCNGCSCCGNCTGEKILVGRDEFLRIQQDRINASVSKNS
jgi:protein gp37